MTSPNLQMTKLLQVVRDKEHMEANVCILEERGSFQPCPHSRRLSVWCPGGSWEMATLLSAINIRTAVAYMIGLPSLTAKLEFSPDYLALHAVFCRVGEGYTFIRWCKCAWVTERYSGEQAAENGQPQLTPPNCPFPKFYERLSREGGEEKALVARMMPIKAGPVRKQASLLVYALRPALEAGGNRQAGQTSITVILHWPWWALCEHLGIFLIFPRGFHVTFLSSSPPHSHNKETWEEHLDYGNIPMEVLEGLCLATSLQVPLPLGWGRELTFHRPPTKTAQITLCQSKHPGTW